MNELVDIPTRADIEALQAQMVQMPQASLQTHHYFANGMYCRELVVPQNITLVGKVHRQEHFFVLMSGEMTLVSDGQRLRVTGPRIFVSQPGVKRAGYAHTDCVCINVHRTFETDLEALEREITEPDETARFGAGNLLLESS